MAYVTLEKVGDIGDGYCRVLAMDAYGCPREWLWKFHNFLFCKCRRMCDCQFPANTTSHCHSIHFCLTGAAIGYDLNHIWESNNWFENDHSVMPLGNCMVCRLWLRYVKMGMQIKGLNMTSTIVGTAITIGVTSWIGINQWFDLNLGWLRCDIVFFSFSAQQIDLIRFETLHASSIRHDNAISHGE